MRCGTILLKVANPEEKNADHLVLPLSAYLLSTTHLKDVRFPWVTLYIYLNFKFVNLWLYCRLLLSEIVKKLRGCDGNKIFTAEFIRVSPINEVEMSVGMFYCCRIDCDLILHDYYKHLSNFF